MKRENLFLILLATALLLAILLTIIFKGDKSRHGYGAMLKIPRLNFRTSGGDIRVRGSSRTIPPSLTAALGTSYTAQVTSILLFHRDDIIL